MRGSAIAACAAVCGGQHQPCVLERRGMESSNWNQESTGDGLRAIIAPATHSESRFKVKCPSLGVPPTWIPWVFTHEFTWVWAHAEPGGYTANLYLPLSPANPHLHCLTEAGTTRSHSRSKLMTLILLAYLKTCDHIRFSLQTNAKTTPEVG